MSLLEREHEETYKQVESIIERFGEACREEVENGKTEELDEILQDTVKSVIQVCGMHAGNILSREFHNMLYNKKE